MPDSTPASKKQVRIGVGVGAAGPCCCFCAETSDGLVFCKQIASSADVPLHKQRHRSRCGKREGGFTTIAAAADSYSSSSSRRGCSSRTGGANKQQCGELMPTDGVLVVALLVTLQRMWGLENKQVVKGFLRLFRGLAV